MKTKFGYGENGCIKFGKHSDSFEETLKAATQEGHGFIVREEYDDDETCKRVLIGWRVSLLSYESACQAFNDDEVTLRHLKTYYDKGNRIFIKVPLPGKDAYMVFPASEYDLIERMTPEQVLNVIKKAGKTE